MASQITDILTTACSDQLKKIKGMHGWPFVRGIHLSPGDSPHKGQVMRKAFPCMTSSWKHRVQCKNDHIN